MKKFLAPLRLCAIVFFISSPLTILNAQTATQLQTLLQTNAVTHEQAVEFVLEAAEIEQQDPFDYALQQKWIPKKAQSSDSPNLQQTSLLLMRAFDIKGGLFYSMFKTPHYAYRELVYKGIIQGRVDPRMKVSGDMLLFLVNRILYLQDSDPWALSEIQEEYYAQEEAQEDAQENAQEDDTQEEQQ